MTKEQKDKDKRLMCRSYWGHLLEYLFRKLKKKCQPFTPHLSKSPIKHSTLTPSPDFILSTFKLSTHYQLRTIVYGQSPLYFQPPIH